MKEMTEKSKALHALATIALPLMFSGTYVKIKPEAKGCGTNAEDIKMLPDLMIHDINSGGEVTLYSDTYGDLIIDTFELKDLEL